MTTDEQTPWPMTPSKRCAPPGPTGSQTAATSKWSRSSAGGNVRQRRAAGLPDGRGGTDRLRRKLLGIPYNTGTPATTTVEFTVEDAIGYTIPASSQLAIDGYAFDVTNDVVFVANGETSQSALVTAAENSSSYNGLVGANVVGVSLPAFVTNITVDAPTVPGVDPQAR